MDSSRRQLIHAAMVRLADGDRSAIHVLVDELWPVILAFARRGVRHDQDAEDIAQEVFLRICSRISDFDPSRDGLSWAFGVASYEVMTHRRRVARRRETFDEATLGARLDPAQTQEECAIQDQLIDALTALVGQLTEEDRTYLGLSGQPAPIPVGPALRKRRQRALDRVRDLWRRLHGEP